MNHRVESAIAEFFKNTYSVRTYVCMSVHVGMSQLRVSKNTHFPRLRVTKVPSLVVHVQSSVIQEAEEAKSPR